MYNFMLKKFVHLNLCKNQLNLASYCNMKYYIELCFHLNFRLDVCGYGWWLFVHFPTTHFTG